MTTRISHQDAASRFRPLDSTLIMDVAIQSVQGRGRSQVVRQTKQAPVRADDKQSYRKETVTITPNGYQLDNIDGMLMVETSFPISILIGNEAIECNGIFAMTGRLRSVVLVAATPTAATITAVLRNL